MRYAYGLTGALLLGGATLSLLTGFPAGAQIAQNDEHTIQSVVPRVGAPASFAELTEQLQPAVVNISTRQKVAVETNPFAGTPFGELFGGGGGGQDQQPGDGQQQPGQQTREAQSLGSGFVISANGYVVTNNHVITSDGTGKVESISVTMPDGTEYPATVVGSDTASDLAVLKIAPAKPLPFVKFGDSRSARVGDWVIAIGNPFGLGGTVTAGIISAVYRNTGTGSAYDRYLQTDAAINRGNSGGPMFDMKGQVIGINNAIFSPNGGSIGIGFAIPADIAAPIVDRLVKGEAIERGYLGVRIQPLTEDLADSLGIAHNRGEFVAGVEPGKAAALAGIKAGDVVLRVAGHEVSPNQTLSYLVANTQPGSRIGIDLIRNGTPLSLTAVVGKRPSEQELAKSFDPSQPSQDDPFAHPKDQASHGVVEQALGLSTLPLTPQISRELGTTDAMHGLVVNAVDASSDAGAKGLQRGDIITSVNDHPITSVGELETAVKSAQAAHRAAVLLQVVRQGHPATYVPIRLR
ncbi:MAG: Do family serine endopeptidase [Pseudomonadota bacterium]|nr:Do family serine endopeptidase [Pseudomonadota bacterium]